MATGNKQPTLSSSQETQEEATLGISTEQPTLSSSDKTQETQEEATLDTSTGETFERLDHGFGPNLRINPNQQNYPGGKRSSKSQYERLDYGFGRTNPNQQYYQRGSFQGPSQDHGSDCQEREDHSAEGQDIEMEKNRSEYSQRRSTGGKYELSTVRRRLDHASYCGNITGESAEDKLEKEGEPCYLTRYSSNNKCLILSTMTRNKEGQKFDHFVIKIINNCYEIEGTDQQFETIGDMLDYYEKNPIGDNVEHIGRPWNAKGIQQQNKDRVSEVTPRTGTEI